MSDKITPALTPDEWARRAHIVMGGIQWRLAVEDEGASLFIDVLAGEERVAGRDRHALAALALHGQPYGFTHADVAMAREAARVAEFEGYDDIQRAMSSIAARLAALLPPA